MATQQTLWLSAVVLCLCTSPALAQLAAPAAKAPTEGLAPLNEQQTVLLDKAGQRLVLKGEVCLREGVLEMLACLKRSKEHEAIFSVDTKAQIVHAGLLALGFEPGKPVEFVPDYKAATGPVIDIVISWEDAEGKTHKRKAQELVRNSVRRYWVQKLDKSPADLKLPEDGDLRYDEKRRELLWYGPMSDKQRDDALKLSTDAGYQAAIKSFHQSTQVKTLDAEWVFAGSSFYVDPETNQRFYQAEAGDLICVANFSTATIDLAVASSAANEQLLYEAFTERLPPTGTRVTIELKPRKPAAKPDSKPKS
ncbi:MAG: hypothetical protein B7Z55_09695 [Planctomycetales bacterium 12-60-4]|nr:MAG: hypothetical protein B7Z55_09695 [Planctomycetales bacterium 12-60-4]